LFLISIFLLRLASAIALAGIFFNDSSHKKVVSLNRVRAKSRENESKARVQIEAQHEASKEERVWLEDILPHWEITFASFLIDWLLSSGSYALLV